MAMATAMADGDGDGNSQRQGWRQQQWLTATRQRWWQQWSTVTATAMADGNGNGNERLRWQQRWQRQWQRSWQRRWRWQQQWQWQRPQQGQPLQRKGCLFMWQQCAVLLEGRHLASTPMDTNKYACVMGVTLLRVFAPLQGGGFLTAHHGLCFVYCLQQADRGYAAEAFFWGGRECLV